MPVDFLNGPAEGTPFIGDWSQIHHFFNIAIDLAIIVVDKAYEVIQFKFRRRKCSFPNLTFLGFSVSNYTENSRFALLKFETHRDSLSDGKSLTQRSRRGFNEGKQNSIWMSL